MRLYLSSRRTLPVSDGVLSAAVEDHVQPEVSTGILFLTCHIAYTPLVIC
jgi:hypothetical protein